MNPWLKEQLEKRILEFPKYLAEEAFPLKDWRICPARAGDRQVPKQGGTTRFSMGDSWARDKRTWCWFFSEVNIPKKWQNGLVFLYLGFGVPGDGRIDATEAHLYIDGMCYQGIDQNHQEARITQELLSKGSLSLAIKAFSGMEDQGGIFSGAELRLVNQAAYRFYYLFKTAYEAWLTLEDSAIATQLANILERTYNLLDYRKIRSSQFYHSIEQAHSYLEAHLGKLPSKTSPIIYGVGHSHIDVAWLWQLAHTRDKCGRTFSTALRLMDDYPEFKFIQSQPQLYKYVKEDYPELYQAIKDKARAKQWEATGGMFVEADCNLSSGESLIRQMQLGQKFFEQEFGKSSKVLWLPDVFGYSWALPQIIKNSGLDYFMTIKISWNQFNRLPYDTFKWRGIDGTEVLTHFITAKNQEEDPAYTYNGFTHPKVVELTWKNYQQKSINDRLLVAYGYGDGGGGVTREMLETAKAYDKLPFMPKWKFSTAEDYFNELETEIDSKQVPVWDGELYLEYHRGTYTSQAKQKWANRRSEDLLHNLEFVASFAKQVNEAYEYPYDRINHLWELVLLNQFHDIIPGSSIAEVYQDSQKQYQEVFNEGSVLVQEALQAVEDGFGFDGQLVAFNTLSFTRSDTLTWDWEESLRNQVLVDQEGNYYPIQQITVEGLTKASAWIQDIPAYGFKQLRLKKIDNSSKSPFVVEDDCVDTPFYRLQFNDKGQLRSIHAKQWEREILLGPGNVFYAFEDKPLNWDAWDIDIFYQEKSWEVTDFKGMKVLDEGVNQLTLRFVWHYLDSTITQDLIVYANTARLDFRTTVDWHEQQTLLKVAFPVDIRASKATYDIQFGNVERPTHSNTSWDWARFETCAHKWVDLSERDFGVSLLNDCKYGHDIKDNVIRLSLIKSGVFPDKEQDQGMHRFTYSLYPHTGDWFYGKTHQEGYKLNIPLLGYVPKTKGIFVNQDAAFLTVDSEHIVLETVKRAEDSGLLLRFYETAGARGELDLEKVVGTNKQVVETDLRERALHQVKGKVFFKPYQIRTFIVLD